MPRRYEMNKRTAAVGETRRRIVEATVRLHGVRGIFGTTWQDIAREADVSIGTVYKHFPTLDELVPACGELLMERIRPPALEDAAALLAGAEGPADRLAKVAGVLFSFYERGGPHLETDLRERALPAVREWEDYLAATISGFVAAAISEDDAGCEPVRAISALMAPGTFRELRGRGIDVENASAIAAAMAVAWLSTRARH